MKKIVVFMSLVGMVMLFGCAGPYSPGFIISQYDAPMCSPDDSSGLDIGAKSGEAMMVNYLGWIATGDASVTTAAKNGGIRKVKTVDYHYDSLLGIVNKTTTKVTGD